MSVRAETQIDLARVDDGSPGTPGTNGATFTPSVAADGDISWTNDGGLPNPATQNIMGPQGDPGTPGTPGANGVSVSSVEPQYYLSTSDSSATGGSWSSTPPAFVSGYYYWTREYITYSDGTDGTSTAVYNSGMTQAAQDALDAKTIADDTEQHFWFTSTGNDTGAHITEVPQDEWNDVSDPNYHSGGNLLARSNGIAVRDGMTELAQFGTTGAIIGNNDGTESYITQDYRSMQMVDRGGNTYFYVGDLMDKNGHVMEEFTGDGTTTSFTFGISPKSSGYMEVKINGTVTTAYTLSLTEITFTTAPANGATITAEYEPANSQTKVFTFGSRNQSGKIGPNSFVEGTNNIASEADSHSEGNGCVSSGYRSHSEGDNTTASGQGSHSEGYHTVAGNSNAHSEGTYSVASGMSSHSANDHTIAQGFAQTAIGSYNIADGQPSTIGAGSLFIIGNGTADNARSNALTVDWSGNVVASGTLRASTETPTASVTASTGTLVSTTAKRFGNVVQLLVTVQNSSSIAQGGNIFEGTLSTTALQPLMTTTSGSYYSTSAITATLSTNGAIVIRNEGGSKTFTSNVNVSFTYIVS